MLVYFFVGQQVANLLSSRMSGEAAQLATSTFLAFAFLVFASTADTLRPVNSTAAARDDATIFSMEVTPDKPRAICGGCQNTSTGQRKF